MPDSLQVPEFEDQDQKSAQDFRMRKEEYTINDILSTCLYTTPQIGDIWQIQKHLGNLKIALGISGTDHPINATHY